MSSFFLSTSFFLPDLVTSLKNRSFFWTLSGVVKPSRNIGFRCQEWWTQALSLTLFALKSRIIWSVFKRIFNCHTGNFKRIFYLLILTGYPQCMRVWFKIKTNNLLATNVELKVPSILNLSPWNLTLETWEPVSNFHAIPQKLRNHDYFLKLNDEICQ